MVETRSPRLGRGLLALMLGSGLCWGAGGCSKQNPPLVQLSEPLSEVPDAGATPAPSRVAGGDAGGPCRPGGEPCRAYRECCSQVCAEGICRACAAVEQGCDDQACCAGLTCFRGECRQCGVDHCMRHGDCCSGVCANGRCSCTQPREACKSSDACCDGDVCENGRCCGGESQRCLEGDCCEGLVCGPTGRGPQAQRQGRCLTAAADAAANAAAKRACAVDRRKRTGKRGPGLGYQVTGEGTFDDADAACECACALVGRTDKPRCRWLSSNPPTALCVEDAAVTRKPVHGR
jgi:hypothetical protein